MMMMMMMMMMVRLNSPQRFWKKTGGKENHWKNWDYPDEVIAKIG